MSAIDNVTGHFSRQLVRTIEVEEWAGEDGKPMLIYAHPLTLADKQKLRAYAERSGDMEVLAYTLITKARDDQDKPLFTIADKHALMHRTDPDVLARVVREITRPRTVEEMEKNSAPIQN